MAFKMKLSKNVIQRAQRGDEIALDMVLSEVLSFLEDFIGSHIGSVADRDDLVQEALTDINRNFAKYDVSLSFGDWVASYAWQRINWYKSGEYSNGARKRASAKNIPPAWREITFTDWLGDVEFEDIEGEINPNRVIS